MVTTETHISTSETKAWPRATPESPNTPALFCFTFIAWGRPANSEWHRFTLLWALPHTEAVGTQLWGNLFPVSVPRSYAITAFVLASPTFSNLLALFSTKVFYSWSWENFLLSVACAESLLPSGVWWAWWLLLSIPLTTSCTHSHTHRQVCTDLATAA